MAQLGVEGNVVFAALGVSLHSRSRSLWPLLYIISAGPVPLVPDVAQEVVQRVDAMERSFDGLEQTVGQHCLRVSALEGSFRELEELVVRSHDQLSSCVGEGARFSHELGLLQEALADRSSELSVLQSSFGSVLLDFESLASRLNPVVLVLGSRVSDLEVSLGSLAAIQAQESCLPLKEQLSEVQDQLSRVLDWQSLFEDCVGDPNNICQSDRLVHAIFNVLSVDPRVRDLLAAEDFRLACGE